MGRVRRRPVITGLGIISPIGTGVREFWKSALAGRSGIGIATCFDPESVPAECRIVGEVPDFVPSRWVPAVMEKTAGRFSQFALATAQMASSDSHFALDGLPAERLKIAIGTSLHGEIDVAEPNFRSFLDGGDIWPWACLEYPAHAATSHVAIALGARAQTATFATACAAGIDAIAWAADEVAQGRASLVVAGGTETPLSPFVLKVFRAVGVLSTWAGPPAAASRPFDRLRSGLVLAEGAAAVIVEDAEHARERDAPIYAEILSCASVTEGHHLRKVDETGDGAARAISAALEAARLHPADIDYVCAHGNSMRDYDAAETAGIRRVFNRYAWHVPVSSIKSMCGQALAASSAMQVVAACLVLRDQLVPPTINYEFPDPSCDLDYVPNRPRKVRARHVLIHTHSLGGSHVAMVLRAPG